MTDKRDLERHEHVDDGLKMAFGQASGSVLDAIESRSGTRPRILFRDAPEDASPVLRVPGRRDEEGATDDSRYQIVGEIALKVLRAEFADNDPVVQRFIEEAQVGASSSIPASSPCTASGCRPGAARTSR